MLTHPAPAVRARAWDINDPVPPKTALHMWRLALATGWVAELTYARGVTLPSQHSDGELVHSAALRIRCGPDAAYAAWIASVAEDALTWRFSSSARASLLDGRTIVPLKLTLSEFKKLLEPPGLF